MHESLHEGRYVLLGPFAEGAQGKTYDAVDKLEGRAVVVKRMEVRGAKSWKDVELAEREATVLRSLSHPKLPAYYDHFEEDGALYLVMEKIEGESLGRMKRRGAKLGEREVRRLLADAADVLRYLHQRGPAVIHRDLKPGNVIRRPDGSFAFVDFGAVRDKLKPEGGSTVVGTFGYMAPEQFQGRALPASDVYAIGATALTMLTGEEPEDQPHKGLAIDVKKALGGSVSAELAEVLATMLEPDPDKRAPIIPSFDPRASARDTRGAADSDRDGKRVRNADSPREREKRRDVRAARRAEKRAQKQARRASRRDDAETSRGGLRGARTVPWPLSLLIAVGIAIAALAVVIVTKGIVPLVLRTLAAFIAPDALRRAANRVNDAGDRASNKMRDAMRGIRIAADAEPVARVRVAPAAKVAEDGARADDEGEASDAEDADDEPLRKKKRRG